MRLPAKVICFMATRAAQREVVFNQKYQALDTFKFLQTLGYRTIRL